MEKNNDTARNPISFFMPPPILIVLHMFADWSPGFHRKVPNLARRRDSRKTRLLRNLGPVSGNPAYQA